MAHGDALEGKWRGKMRMEWVAGSLASTLHTPRLPVVDWTDPPADLNGLVRFAERPILVSARVPSRFALAPTALLYHDRGTRRGWVISSTPWPHFTPGKEPVTILQDAGWALGSVWTGGKSRPNRDSIPDRPALSQSLYWLSYPATSSWYTPC